MSAAGFVGAAPDGRTRIKLCGMTRAEDVDAAVALGVDAIGFVFWDGSPRCVDASHAATLVARIPADVAAVGLFVDAPRDALEAALDAVPLTHVQLHGDEPPARYAGLRVPVVKAVRMSADTDLLAFLGRHRGIAALLLDSHTAGYGGSGKVFDWSLVPPVLLDSRAAAPVAGGAPRVVLSGGLNAANVAAAIERVRPWAVDASSGIEVTKGVKDAGRMREFVAAVRATDSPVS